jgi:hypothetical protein
MNIEHDLGGELTRVGESDRAGVADAIPADAIAQGIDRVPAFAARRLHADGEAVLPLVPDHVPLGLGLEATDV